MKILRALLLPLLLATQLGGCAILRKFDPAVQMTPMTPGQYITLKRGDILTTGALSQTTAQTLRVAALDDTQCMATPQDCINVMSRAGESDERRQSAISELWLRRAMSLPTDPASYDARLEAWTQAARSAYVYLFFTGRTPGERAFEDRQTQARDWYNYAVQEATRLLFEANASASGSGGGEVSQQIERAGWTFDIDLAGVRLPEGTAAPSELFPASALAFDGLRSTWRRDGFGAELVAVMEEGAPVQRIMPVDGGAGMATDVAAGAWSEMPSPGITVLFRFTGDTLQAMLESRQVHVSVYDPYAADSVELHGQQLPLAANFTAGYGLWLARSGFNRQSLQTLFGSEKGIARPHLYMMQPYDPQRRIIVMLHGLASSPEAWVNVANEIQGDDRLRKNFQIWLVYYPTNAPIALNHAAIRILLSRTLRHFDPEQIASASQDMVLIGHSMGGVIGRLLVSSADQQLWNWAEQAEVVRPDGIDGKSRSLDAVLRFTPFPGMDRAIFIAAPHRGTAAARSRVGRFISGLVKLPLSVLDSFGEILQAEPNAEDGTMRNSVFTRMPNSIQNLDERNPFVLVAADLPIGQKVRYHSIMGRIKTDGMLQESSDGVVPYQSAHLPGALSEKVIAADHSVQQTPAAILEIRRILHQDLDEAYVRASTTD